MCVTVPTAARCGWPKQDDGMSVVRKVRVADAIPHKLVASWPYSFRPEDYDFGAPIDDCPSY